MNPSYVDAVSRAVDGIAEASEHMKVPEYVAVIIAGVIGDVFEVECRQVYEDMREAMRKRPVAHIS